MILSHRRQKRRQSFCVAAPGSAGTKQSSLYEHLGHFSIDLIHLEIKTSFSSRHGSTSTARNMTFSKRNDNRFSLNFASPPWILLPSLSLHWLQMWHCCEQWGFGELERPSDWIFGGNFCAAGFHFQENKLQNGSKVWWTICMRTRGKVDVVGHETCGLLGSVCVLLRCITWNAGDKWCHLFLSVWGVFKFEST